MHKTEYTHPVGLSYTIHGVPILLVEWRTHLYAPISASVVKLRHNTQYKKNQLPGRLPCYRYVRIHSTTMLCSLWLALCIFFAASSVTTAKDCRETASVMESADLKKNAKMGGHVWIHVFGLTRPLTKDAKNQQKVGKTMFQSEEDYKLAWSSFVNPTFKTTAKLSECGGRPCGNKDCIPAAALGISEAFVCKEIDDETGLCSAVDVKKKGLNVGFWYAHSKGKWILMTAYPSTHPQCS